MGRGLNEVRRVELRSGRCRGVVTGADWMTDLVVRVTLVGTEKTQGPLKDEWRFKVEFTGQDVLQILEDRTRSTVTKEGRDPKKLWEESIRDRIH